MVVINENDSIRLYFFKPFFSAVITFKNRAPIGFFCFSKVKGRTYWALHGHQWVKAQVTDILHAIDILTLEPHPIESLKMNAIGRVELKFKEPIMAQNFQDCRLAGSMILVDTATHQTAGAVLIDLSPTREAALS